MSASKYKISEVSYNSVNPYKAIENNRLQKSKKIKIIQCQYCGEKFAFVRRKGRPPKYCTEYCRKSARKEQNRLKAYTWYHKNKHRLTEKQRYGLGTGNLSKHRNNDFNKEKNIIKNELKRLKIK